MSVEALLGLLVLFHQAGADSPPSTSLADINLNELASGGAISEIWRLIYDLTVEAKSIRLEAASMRSEAQSIRAEARTSKIEAQALIKEAERVKTEAAEMREEGRAMMDEGNSAMKQAFDVLLRAFVILDEGRGADNCSDIADVIDSVKQDTAASSAALSLIANRLNNIDDEISETVEKFRNITTFQGIYARLDAIESAIGTLDKKVDDSDDKVQLKLDDLMTSSDNLTTLPGQLVQVGSVLGIIDDKLEDASKRAESLEQKLEDKTTSLGEQVEVSKEMVQAIKTRQQTWMSEIRLISLYKMADESNGHPDYMTGSITDGLVGFSEYHNNVRVYSAKASASANEKIWIKLGGLFRVHRIQVWNIRITWAKCRFEDTRILVDDTHIGTAVGVAPYYDFKVSSEVYGSTVTLHQPRSTDMNVVEVQVWGCGPFNETDKFA